MISLIRDRLLQFWYGLVRAETNALTKWCRLQECEFWSWMRNRVDGGFVAHFLIMDRPPTALDRSKSSWAYPKPAPRAAGYQMYTKNQLFRYIHGIVQAQQRNYQIVENRARYFKVNCSSAPQTKFLGTPNVCQFCIFAKAVLDSEGNPTDYWKIYRCNEMHQCGKVDSKRRAHDGRVLLTLSQSLKDFVPNDMVNLGSSRQVCNIARVSEGIPMKRGQALNVLQAKRNTAMPVHIGQYMLLQSYLNMVEIADPNGTVDYEYQECEWKEADEHATDWSQFVRCYVSFGFCKRLWAHGTLEVVVADGTFTTSGLFKHTILLAVTKDGNNQLLLLAYCICDGENKANWLYFLNKLREDFPTINVFLSDYDKGVECEAFQAILTREDIGYARCVRHMLGNCSKLTKKTIGETLKACVYGLARARTEGGYRSYLTKLERLDLTVAQWFDARKKLFATHLLLANGYARNGNILNNMAEQFNSIITELRAKPILDMVIGLNAYMFRKYTERASLADQWYEENRLLVPYAWERHMKMTELAAKQTFEAHPSTDDGRIHCGVVNTDPFGTSISTVFVSVNTITKRQDCPCLYYEEFGRPCKDTWKVIEANCDDKPITDWYETIYHLETYRRAYSCDLPNLSTSGKLEVTALLPPDHTANRGRPKKQRYESQSENPKKCRACGNFGHTQHTCNAPSTEIRIQNYFDKALDYAYEACEENSFDYH